MEKVMEFEELNGGIKAWNTRGWIGFSTPGGGGNSEWFKLQDLWQLWGFFKTHFPALHYIGNMKL